MIDKTDIKYFESLKNLNELSKKYNSDLIKDFIYDVKRKILSQKL